MRATSFCPTAVLAIAVLSSAACCDGYYFKEKLYDPLSAKAAAMGGAVCALPGDLAAVDLSPATLAFLDHTDAYLTYSLRRWEIPWTPWFEPRRQGYQYEHYLSAGFARPIAPGRALGANLAYSLSDEEEWIDPYGNPSSSIRAYTIFGGGSYAGKLNEHLAIGASAKFLYDSYSDYDWYEKAYISRTGKTFALGASLLHGTPTGSIALSVLNLGPDIEYRGKGGSVSLPKTLRAGISMMVFQNEANEMVATCDIVKALTGEGEVGLRAGAEHTFFGILSVRVGYVTDKESNRDGPTSGLGLRIRDSVSLDFAYMSHSYAFPGTVNKYYLTANVALPSSEPAGRKE